VSDNGTSRKHARASVVRSDSGHDITICGIGSSNCTLVNHRRIQACHLPTAGKLIEVANTEMALSA